MTTTTQMLRKAEELEGQARTLRQAAALMNGHYTMKATTQLDKRLTKAAALRDAASPPPPTRTQRAQSWSDAVGAALDPATAYTSKELRQALIVAGVQVPSSPHLTTLLRQNGWKAKGRSYAAIWTHTGNGTAPKARKARKARKDPRSEADHQKNRKATARLLDRLAKHDGPAPKSFVGRAASPLLTHGYIKRSGDGYERTEKPFQV